MRLRLAPGLSLGVLLVGCQSNLGELPPQVRYGEEACAQCRMLISEARYAAVLVKVSGDVEKFDDIGCLVRYRARHPEVAKRVWVHDFASDRWLEASAAFFVHSRELPTPMGSGIVALATSEEAARLGSTAHGNIVPFGSLASMVVGQAAGGRPVGISSPQ